MKHFKIIGPETTREFDIEDNEMIHWQVLKISEGVPPSDKLPQAMKNEKIYPTEKS